MPCSSRRGPARPTARPATSTCSAAAPPVALFRELCDQLVEQDSVLVLDAGSVAAREIREDPEHGGVRVMRLGFLGNGRVPLQVDVGFGDAISPGPRELTYPSLLPDSPRPVLPAYPPETAMAEKLQAMIDLGMANTRMKDFFDVWLLLRDFDVDDALLVDAVRATFARRGTPLPEDVPIALPDALSQDVAKRVQWLAFLRRAGLVSESGGPELAEVVDNIDSDSSPCGLSVAFRQRRSV